MYLPKHYYPTTEPDDSERTDGIDVGECVGNHALELPVVSGHKRRHFESDRGCHIEQLYNTGIDSDDQLLGESDQLLWEC